MEVGRPAPAGAPVSSQGPMPMGTSGGAAATSLYQQTMLLIERLYSIPGFERYLFPEGVENYITSPNNAQGSAMIMDPVSVVWNCFRLGAPFCVLYNQLRIGEPLAVPEVPSVGQPYDKTCKKAVYTFFVACQTNLDMRESDFFPLSGLYKDDTNEFVQLIKTVNIILTKIQERGVMPPARNLPFALPTRDATTQPSDNRSKLIAELLKTERDYTADLEKLQQFKTECKNSNVVSRDMILKLFANLDDLLDFQRRFLLQMEACLSMPINEQRVGVLFLQNEGAFSVYIPFCANYPGALNLAVNKQEILTGVSPSMDPRMLQNYLIKPIQRVCKYPLLLRELIKLSTDSGYLYMDELVAGTEAVKRVVDRVNEEKRNEENRALKKTVIRKVDDWKGLKPDHFGDLILSDHFPMMVGESEHNYELFLFEKILLCCKPVHKKVKKSKKNGTVKPGSEELAAYILMGNIYIERVDNIVNSSVPDQLLFQIKVFWRDGAEVESFVLKCRNIEQVNLWYDRIEYLLNLARMRRMSVHDLPRGAGMNNMYDQSGELDLSSESLSGGGSNVRYGSLERQGGGRHSISSQATVTQSTSQEFNTRSSHDYGMAQQQQVYQMMKNHRRSSPAPARGSYSNQVPPANNLMNGINNAASIYQSSSNGNLHGLTHNKRTSSSSRTRSQSPTSDRRDHGFASPRTSVTEAILQENGFTSPTSTLGGDTPVVASIYPSGSSSSLNGGQQNSAGREGRSRSRSRGMSIGQGYPGNISYNPNHVERALPPHPQQGDEGYYTNSGEYAGQVSPLSPPVSGQNSPENNVNRDPYSRSRHASNDMVAGNGLPPQRGTSGSSQQPMSRAGSQPILSQNSQGSGQRSLSGSRSSSQLLGPGGYISQPTQGSQNQAAFQYHQHQQQKLRSANSLNAINTDVNNGNGYPAGRKLSNNAVSMIQQQQQQQQLNSATGSGVSTPQSATVYDSASGMIKVKAHYGSDIFMLAIPRNFTYVALLKKLEHKVKLCSSLPSTGTLKIRYRDEDGDFIAVYSDEEVQMAIENSRQTGIVSLWLS